MTKSVWYCTVKKKSKKKKKTYSLRKKIINLPDVYLINSVPPLNEVSNLGAGAATWDSC